MLTNGLSADENDIVSVGSLIEAACHGGRGHGGCLARTTQHDAIVYDICADIADCLKG
jgi:hypothetical protein